MPFTSLMGFLQQPTPTVTPLPRLIKDSLRDDLAELELYFTIPIGAQASNENGLAVIIKDGQNFNPNTAAHKQFIKDCTALFKTRYNRLLELDKQLSTAILIAVVASSFSFLFLVNFVCYAAWIYAAYQLYQRTRVYDSYYESLKLLVATCNWILGPAERIAQEDETAYTDIPEIRDMMRALYPVLTKTQLEHLSGDTFAAKFDEFESQFDQSYSRFTLFQASAQNPQAQTLNTALNKRSLQFNQGLYGFEQGNPENFTYAFFVVLPDLWRFACNSFTKLKQACEERFISEQQNLPT